MAAFFTFFSTVSVAAMLVALWLAYWPGFLGLGPQIHLFAGLIGAILASAAHCLIFGIFTGSGKDTRELVQDLSLDKSYVEKTKSFRRIAFPPAMYAILFLMAVSILGGAAGKWGTLGRYLHAGFAWVAVLYNLKTFWLELKCIRENSAILASVNQLAQRKIAESPAQNKDAEIPLLSDTTVSVDWGTHVFALGKFLTFLGWNVWLPYVYVRVIMAYSWVAWYPFLAASCALLLGGYYLRWRYRAFRPRRPASGAPRSAH